ncbi:MAG: hypothetical protein WD035_03045 [Balneolaceae bacterium]
MKSEENKDEIDNSSPDIQESDYKTKLKEIIEYYIDPPVPETFNSIEVEGIPVKEYPFINCNTKMKHPSEILSEYKIQHTNAELLITKKAHLEERLNLNRSLCLDHYKTIKQKTGHWLWDKIMEAGNPQEFSVDEREKIQCFIYHLHIIIKRVMLGEEKEFFKNSLKKLCLTDNKITLHSLHNSTGAVVLDIDEWMDRVSQPLEDIERTVSRSVHLYFEYINTHCYLYNLNIELIFSEIQNSSSMYGFHQKNRAWIKKTFTCLKKGSIPLDKEIDKTILNEIDNVEGRGLSDNKVAKQVSILYKYKFERIISPDQVKRMVIYENR